MKILTKTALAIAMTACIASAQAVQVELVFDPSESVVYEAAGLTIDGLGNITITGAEYISGYLPGSDGSLSCGDNTTEVDGVCVAPAPVTCGANTVKQGQVCVGTGGGSSVPSSSSSSSAPSSTPSSSSSSSSSSVDLGNCTVAPNTQIIDSPFSWSQYTGSMQIPIPGNGTTLSFPVTTGSRAGAVGGMSGGELSWTAGVMRNLWISQCPGGAPVKPACNQQSTAAMGINWVQGTKRGFCELSTNTSYYVNMRNVFDPVNTISNCYIVRGVPNCNGFIQHKPSGDIN